MNEKGVDLDAALGWVAVYHEQVLSEFQAQYRALAFWDPATNLRVKTYVERLARFIRGIDCWAFETERYFGDKGPEIKRQRIVDLLPKAEAVAPMMMAPCRELIFEASEALSSATSPIQPHIYHLIVLWTGPLVYLVVVKTLNFL
jgi:hypothetical protein